MALMISLVGAVCQPVGLTVLLRALLLGGTLLLVSIVPASGPGRSADAQTPARGRVLAPSRGQVAWLDLQAPRPTAITDLVRPAYPADVAGAPGVAFAVASLVRALGGAGAMGGDLVLLDLAGATTRPLLVRNNESESLDAPAIWPDGSAILYQRADVRKVLPMPGQAQPQYRSSIEQIDPQSGQVVPLLQDGRYPGPAPDGSRFAFVRSTDRGAAIFSHALADGSDALLVAPGQFLAVAYPRFSPDGQQLAFAAISVMSPVGQPETPRPPLLLAGLSQSLGARPALAHGFPWEAWIANADGTGLHQVPDVIDDDPSLAWSPDSSQLLIYGGWGSFLVDAQSGATTSLAFLAGYGSVAWLPD